MKCAEVMEWMHRYLDHDLSQDEILEMFRHIDNCPSCADVFDRLTLLSQELEQLPDVKPPFSLVDSILPQLDKLDQGVQQQSMVNDEEPNKVVPITRSNNRSKTPSKGGSMAARTGIGAVAAAVILFIAVFNMPDSIPQAEVETSLQQAADSSNNGAMNKMTTESSGTSENGAENSSVENSAGDRTVSTEMPDNEPEATTFVGSVDQDTARTASPAEPSAAPTKRAKQAPAVSDAPAVTSQAPPVAHKTEVPTPVPDAADTGEGGNNSIYSIESGDAGDAAAELQEDSPPARSTEAGIMGMLPSLVDPDVWGSADGRYSAELAGQQLVIYSIPASGIQAERTAVTSLPLDGTWVSGSWSADSRQFTYVTLQDGAEITKVYTVPEPAASPSASPQASASAAPGVTPDAEGSNK